MNQPTLSHPSVKIRGMKSDTTMKLVTIPAARQIHPVGHLPSASSANCVPRPSRPTTWLPPMGSPVLDASDDTFMLGVRVRNAPHFRQRRALAAVAATTVVLVVWSLLSIFAHHLVPAAAGDPIPSSAAAVHVVQPGDTLWSIATDVVGAPDNQVRQVVDRLAARSGGASLEVGQRVSLDGLAAG